MTKQSRAYIFAGLAIFFWSTVATAFKIGLQYLNFVQFLFFACCTSFAILLTISIINGDLRFLRKLSGKDLAFAALMGFLNPFSYYLVLFKAYELLPAQVAQPLNMVWPIVLVFLSVIVLKQKVSGKSFIALFISFIGVYLISTQGDPTSFTIQDPLGVLLAVGSSLIWSFYWIYNLKTAYNETFQLTLNFLFASIFITILMFLVSGFQDLHYKGVLLASYAGGFEMGITFILWLKAMKLTSTNDKISNLVYIAPFISLIFIHFMVGETIYVTSMAGLTFIVLGILIEKIRWI
jgi:drug/metabolite transporter (DMT)-like permease